MFKTYHCIYLVVNNVQDVFVIHCGQRRVGCLYIYWGQQCAGCVYHIHGPVFCDCVSSTCWVSPVHAWSRESNNTTTTAPTRPWFCYCCCCFILRRNGSSNCGAGVCGFSLIKTDKKQEPKKNQKGKCMLKGDFPYSSGELTLFAASPLRRSRPPPLQHFAIQRRVSRVYLTGARRGGQVSRRSTGW